MDPNPSDAPESPNGAHDPASASNAGPADASREAKRYRLRLRETEAERDGLRERIDGFERAEAERIASTSGMATPADLWALAELADFRDDAGRLAPDRVAEKVAAVLAERPGWRATLPDLGAGARGGNGKPAPGLSTLFGKG